jgi:hypothetical protein
MRPNEQQVHNLKSTLVHRYDDIRDILAVKRFKCSEVYSSSVKVFKFDRVAVVPTKTVPYDLVAYGDAISGQYKPKSSENWPGRSGPYNFRIDIENVRFFTLTSLKQAITGKNL